MNPKCAGWTELSFRRILDALVSASAHDTARISSVISVFCPLSRFNRTNAPRLSRISASQRIVFGIFALAAGKSSLLQDTLFV